MHTRTTETGWSLRRGFIVGVDEWRAVGHDHAKVIWVIWVGERSHCLTVNFIMTLLYAQQERGQRTCRRLCRGLKTRLGQARGCIRDRGGVPTTLSPMDDYEWCARANLGISTVQHRESLTHYRHIAMLPLWIAHICSDILPLVFTTGPLGYFMGSVTRG